MGCDIELFQCLASFNELHKNAWYLQNKVINNFFPNIKFDIAIGLTLLIQSVLEWPKHLCGELWLLYWWKVGILKKLPFFRVIRIRSHAQWNSAYLSCASKKSYIHFLRRKVSHFIYTFAIHFLFVAITTYFLHLT